MADHGVHGAAVSSGTGDVRGSGERQQGAARAWAPFCRGRGARRRSHDADVGAEAVAAMSGWTGRGAEVGDGADLWPRAISG